ncbi:MAG: DMT family transporter [Prevotellaceae bacterium]|jgi:drug/metabolite transporter (DMT)-like permease|nr:DMT family transporter [Prevotellaceae bacterium]
MMNRNRYLYHLIALAAVTVWGLTFISTKKLIQFGITPEEIFVLRFLVAYAGIWVLALFPARGASPRQPASAAGQVDSPRRLWAASWKDELLLLLGGITGGSVYFWAENTALSYTQATNVSFIVCTAPLYTALLSLLIERKERATLPLLFGSLLAVVGMGLVVYNGQFVLKLSPLGDILSLTAALVWACYSLIMRRMSDRYHTLFITRKIFFYGILTILPTFIYKPWSAGMSLLVQPAILFNLLFLGVLASLVCYAAWNLVLRQLGTVRASNYIYLNPVFTLLGSALWLSEQITATALLGAGCILAGVYWAGKRGGNQS